MTPVFNEEQTMLRKSLERCLAKNCAFEQRQANIQAGLSWSDPFWRELAEIGVLMTPFPEEMNGLGGKALDVVAVSEILGAGSAIEPYSLGVATTGKLLTLVENRNAVLSLVSDLQDGSAIAALAYDEGNGIGGPEQICCEARECETGFVLDGEKRFVLNATEAERIIVIARLASEGAQTANLCVMMIDPEQAGVEFKNYRTLDGRTAANISFTNVAIAPERVLSAGANTKSLVEKALDVAIVSLCAEAIGAMGRLAELSGEYASTRKQFGKPIGKFQAIRHRLADMQMNYQKARATLMIVASDIDSEASGSSDVSVLKLQTGRMGLAVAESAVQIHGGVGTTDELIVGHLLKRVLTVNSMFGGWEHHAARVGAAALASQ